MSSTANNFYKNASKAKFAKLYGFDRFKSTNNFGEATKRNSSVSPTKVFPMRDSLKHSKNISILPLMNSYNEITSHKLLDIVLNQFHFYKTFFPLNNYKLINQIKDKLQEELIKHKNEINKKNKELHNLRIAFIKLDEENKKNIKIIQEIITAAGRSSKSESGKVTPEELEKEIKQTLEYTHPTEKVLLRLKEVFLS